MTCGSGGVLQGGGWVFKPGRAAAALALAWLAGCSGRYDPVAFWHEFEGGRITAPRPAVPGAETAYPNLASVPARPATEDAASRGRIAVGLIADRANAQYSVRSALAPLPTGRAASAAPAPANQVRPPAPAIDSGMSASLQAAGRLETPATAPPRPAPIARVTTSELAPPALLAPPDLPTAPPPPARLPGVAAITAPAPPQVAPPSVAAPVVLPDAASVAIGFVAGSASLPESALASLNALAVRRAGRGITVAGFGDAAEADQTAQANALPLAWERSGAIARVLQAAGVPESALTITARATGHGGVARIAEP